MDLLIIASNGARPCAVTGFLISNYSVVNQLSSTRVIFAPTGFNLFSNDS